MCNYAIEKAFSGEIFFKKKSHFVLHFGIVIVSVRLGKQTVVNNGENGARLLSFPELQARGVTVAMLYCFRFSN